MDFKQKSQLYKLYVKIQVIKNDIYLSNSRKTPPVQLFHMLEGKNIEIYMGSPTKLKLMEDQTELASAVSAVSLEPNHLLQSCYLLFSFESAKLWFA
jgi:hypothetical protein